MIKNIRIWLWTYNNKIFKAIICCEDQTYTIYNEFDEILVKRIGLMPSHIERIESSLIKSGAKRIDRNKDAFVYL